MQYKVAFLWLFIAIGWIVHHIYGLFGVYYNETLMMEGADGTTPLLHHAYRILFEGSALLFAFLSLVFKGKGILYTSLIWAVIGGIYNLYHLGAAIVYEPKNISEHFILVWMVLVSAYLIKTLNESRKSGLE